MDQIVSSLKQLAIPEPNADELTWLKPTYDYTSYHSELAAMSEWSADISPFFSSQNGTVLTCEEVVEFDRYAGFYPTNANMVHPKPLSEEFIIILDVHAIPPFSGIWLRFLTIKDGHIKWETVIDAEEKGRYFIFKEEGKSECQAIDIGHSKVKTMPCKVSDGIYLAISTGLTLTKPTLSLPLKDKTEAFNKREAKYYPGGYKLECSPKEISEDEKKFEGRDRVIKLRIKVENKI